jgi:hypothetical protein
MHMKISPTKVKMKRKCKINGANKTINE